MISKQIYLWSKKVKKGQKKVRKRSSSRARFGQPLVMSWARDGHEVVTQKSRFGHFLVKKFTRRKQKQEIFNIAQVQKQKNIKNYKRKQTYIFM